MTKYLFIILIAFSIPTSFSQTNFEDENISLEVTKARKIGTFSVQFGTNNMMINSGKYNKRVQLRLKVRSLDKELTLFDPNKLTIVSEKKKSRYSVSQIDFPTYFKAKGFYRVTNKETDSHYVTYEPSIKNTFFDYSIEGMKDCPISINFGTRRKPDIHTIYFSSQTIKKNLLDVFYVVPNSVIKIKVYYKDVLISEHKIRK